jgi:hypothetical protein
MKLFNSGRPVEEEVRIRLSEKLGRQVDIFRPDHWEADASIMLQK